MGEEGIEGRDREEQGMEVEREEKKRRRSRRRRREEETFFVAYPIMLDGCF